MSGKGVVSIVATAERTLELLGSHYRGEAVGAGPRTEGQAVVTCCGPSG